MSITQLYSYPVKGLSSAALNNVALKPNAGFPADRKFALALPDTEFDVNDPKPVPKTKFLMLARYESFANLVTQYDADQESLIIRDKTGKLLCDAALNDPSERTRIEKFFRDYLPDVLDTAPRLVQAEGHQFTDVSVVSKEMMHAVSLINLASLRALEDAVGQSIDPMRFRANIYFDNGDPWSEFDWIDNDVLVGSVTTKAVRRTRRCPATQVNPETAQRDIDVPAELEKHFGHRDLGIYVEVQEPGHIGIGDAVIR